MKQVKRYAIRFERRLFQSLNIVLVCYADFLNPVYRFEYLAD